jgi:hypothetical protein
MLTGMVEEIARSNLEFMKKTEEAHSLGRIAEPKEISRRFIPVHG